MEALDEQLINTESKNELPLLRKLQLVFTQPKRFFNLFTDAKAINFKELILLLLLMSIITSLTRSKGTWHLLAGYYKQFNVLELPKNLVLFIGIVLGMVTLLKWTGTWLGGQAHWNLQFAVYVYASVPVLLFLLFQIPLYSIYMYYARSAQYPTGYTPSWYQTLLEAVRYIKWGINASVIILHVIGIASVQNFGYVKAVLNLLLAAFFFAVPLLMLYYMGLL